MAPTSAFIFRAARPLFSQPISPISVLRAQPARSGLRNASQRRFTTTDAGAAQTQPWFSRMWNSPVGFKTVHFWAPVLKWAIVVAGISDFARPAEKLSLTQNAALTATGLIWTRWCFVIKPKNYLLAAVNFFLGVVGIAQVSRIFMYRSSLEKEEAKAKAITAA